MGFKNFQRYFVLYKWAKKAILHKLKLKGTPFVFEGQEIGMTNGDFKDLTEVEDIESHNIYAMAKGLGIPKRIRWKMIQRTSRDNARTPYQWNDRYCFGTKVFLLYGRRMYWKKCDFYAIIN